MDYEELTKLTAQYIGITDQSMMIELRHFVQTAVELCTMQTGQTDFTTSETAKQWVMYSAANMYADRFGELNNKEGSATARLMQNLTFALQQKNRRKAVDIENSDNS